MEFNYSETTFVLPAQQPSHTAQVRIFTPGREVPFAGHPNIGTAFALAQAMAERSETVPRQFVFEEKAGLVPVSLLQQDRTIVGAELLAPEALSRRGRTTVEKAAACLSLASDDIRVDTHPPQVLSVGLPFLVAELASRDALRRCAPNRSGFDALLPFDGAHSVYAYVRAARDDAVSAGADILSRMFTARLNEDPATGSATGALAAMLAGLRRSAMVRSACGFCRASIWGGRVYWRRGWSNPAPRRGTRRQTDGLRPGAGRDAAELGSGRADGRGAREPKPAKPEPNRIR
jgi:trans-2,3-dihydro-3-hydroxyanthranilate isomerase